MINKLILIFAILLILAMFIPFGLYVYALWLYKTVRMYKRTKPGISLIQYIEAKWHIDHNKWGKK